MSAFFKVFPDFRADGELFELLKFANVDRIRASRDRSSLTVYLTFERLVEKYRIYQLGELLKDRLFEGKIRVLNIVESFKLSEQYNPQTLFDLYRDSILLELKNYNIGLYYILCKANVRFDENKMYFTVEDNAFHKGLLDELIRILDKIFNERCNIPCTLHPEYVRAVPKQYHTTFERLHTDRNAQEFMEVRNASEFSMEGDAVSTFRGNGAGKDTNRDAANEVSKEASASGKKAGRSDANAGKASSDKKQSSTSSGKAASAGKFASPAGNANSSAGQSYDDRNYEKKRSPYKSKNPDVLYGRDFVEDFMNISDIVGEMSDVVIRGKIIKLDTRFFEKNKVTLFSFVLTDFTDSIGVKIFARENNLELIKAAIVKGGFISMKGSAIVDRFDHELTISSIFGIRKCEGFEPSGRADREEVKRVELHCHTKMSDGDGVTSAGDILSQIQKWGMDAIAFTDHANVLAAVDAWHALDKIKGNKPKVIYGVEANIVDDLSEIIVNPKETTLDDAFVVFDIETTGFSAKKNKIIEIGAVKVVAGEIVDRYSSFVNPQEPIPFKIETLTGINDEMVMVAPLIDAVLPEFLDFVGDAAVVAHNAGFDTRFIKSKSREIGRSFSPTVVDTLSIGRILFPQMGRHRLDTLAKVYHISLENHHRAVDDAEATARIWQRMIADLKERGIHKLSDINVKEKSSTDLIKRMYPNHAVILAKNDIGRINLYRLISMSNIDFFYERARIPKSMIQKHREGLLIGSACANGEIFSGILDGEDEIAIREKAMFYDYLEVQPASNYEYMIEEDNAVSSMEELIEINKKIMVLGEECEKPVVATGDVHFLNPEDEIYRMILKYSDPKNKNRKMKLHSSPLYLRTTREMLDEFKYLKEEKAYEIVVKNSRMIADMIDVIKPVRPDKCPPSIENSEEILRTSCYAKAHEQYGEVLPKIVEKRLEKELASIIGNGFAVMYIIAKKLVEKSNSDGYLVGSRGSVGSSFAAYASGITEVNPLPPHYYCDCRYSEFDSEEVLAFAGMSGCDMPDKICPKCGANLKKDGHDIPFETFLGFKGDKEPDIDLNFSGEYQAIAHQYTEELFGKGYTYRAGTTSTVAEKTAYGYTRKYLEENNIFKRKTEIERISGGCVGVKRTTGQHPGGIIVLPHGEEIHSFTPIQKPADDMSAKNVTTQFDYHAIDHNLLKLDILGHQDPTMIRKLQDIIGIDPVKDIPLDCKKTMSLFMDTSALGVTPDEILGCKLGARGIPEFGTDFAIQMLVDAKPKGFSDLIRISGLSHGTDVWVGNALTLIEEGKATIRTAICTRDDIMIYLINMGVEEGLSFKIMESVRKGKGLTPEWEAEMLAHGVPDWYIWSCKKIKYMFPKAHAAAYVMMAWRIAYCKIHYPLAYYTAYFTIRATGFSYEHMCFGKAKVENTIAVLKGEGNLDDSTDENEDTGNGTGDVGEAKAKDMLRDLKIVQEMYARGFAFEKIDIYRARATEFFITEDQKIMPSLASIDGLGAVAATNIENAAKNGVFTSKEDFSRRCGIGKATMELLDKYGILDGLPKTNQYSMFDDWVE